MRAVLRPLLGWPGRLAAAVALAVAMLLAGVGLLATSGALIARAALHPDTVLALMVLVTGVRFFGLARAGVRYAERLVAHDLTLRLLADVRARVYRRLHPRAPLGLGGLRSADLLTRLFEDVEELQNVYLRLVAPVLAALLVTVLSVALAALVSPASALVLLAALFLAGAVLPATLAVLERRLGARESALRVAQRTLLLDALQGAQELWVYGRSESQQERLASADGALARLARRRAVLAGIRDGAGAYLAVAGAAAVLAAALPAVQGGPSALLLVPLTLGAMASFEAMQPLADAMARFSPTRASAERLDALLRGEPDVKDPPSPRPVPIGGELQLERVCFAYGDRAVLTDVDLRLAQGRRVALVGPSGAGKSSVLALLVRFADPNAGRVTLHGIDVRAVAQAELRDRCSVVPQRVRLFHGSVRANLALARAGADEAALWRALERADLADVVRALPDGLDTPLGDQGSRLSGGERQRLALARAWLKDAPFWLLDEPTAHLDAAHERRMLRRLLAPDPRRAVLWITHRLVGMEELDEILVLDGGRVVERGAHARLARAGGVYARLLSAQREQLARAG